MLAELHHMLDKVPAEQIPEIVASLTARMGTLLAARAAHSARGGEEDRLLKVPAVADLLALPKARVYELIRRRELPAIFLPGGEKMGKSTGSRTRDCIRVRMGTLRRWLSDHEKNQLDGQLYGTYSQATAGGDHDR